MTALADLSAIVNRCTGGNSGNPQNIFTFTDSRVGAAAAAATVAGRLTSLWTYEGNPSSGAVPTTVAIPTNATAGAVGQTDSSGGRDLWLLGATASPLVAGTLILYDRLLHIGNLSGTVTSAQTVGGSITRNTGGVGNQIWAEVYGTNVGATATTIKATYTDQSGNTGQTSQLTAFGGTGFREAQRIVNIPLASGDTGVQAVASVQITATTGTAGVMGVTIARPLMVMPVGLAGVGTVRDLIAGLPGITKIDPGACLAWAWLANTTTAPQVFSSLHLIEN